MSLLYYPLFWDPSSHSIITNALQKHNCLNHITNIFCSGNEFHMNIFCSGNEFHMTKHYFVIGQNFLRWINNYFLGLFKQQCVKIASKLCTINKNKFVPLKILMWQKLSCQFYKSTFALYFLSRNKLTCLHFKNALNWSACMQALPSS